MKIRIEYADDTFEADFTDDGIEEAVRQFSIMLQSCGYHYETVKDYIDIDSDDVSCEDYNSLDQQLANVKAELFEARETITRLNLESKIDDRLWVSNIKFKSLKKAYDELTGKYDKLQCELFEARETITKAFTQPPVDITYWVDRTYHNSTIETYDRDMEAERFKFKSLKKAYDALTVKLAECRSESNLKGKHKAWDETLKDIKWT